MDHSSLIDIIRSEHFTLVQIWEENKLQLVNTVNVLMNYLSSYPAWIIESGLHDLETSNQLQIILQNTNRVLESHHQLTAEISVTLTVLDALEEAILRLHWAWGITNGSIKSHNLIKKLMANRNNFVYWY